MNWGVWFGKRLSITISKEKKGGRYEWHLFLVLESGTLSATNPIYERKLAISRVESADPAIGGSCQAGDRKKDSCQQVNDV